GEKLMGWTLGRGPDQMPSFYPAERFRKLLYRPDLIRKVLETGSVEKALATTGARGVEIDDVLPPAVKITEVKEVKDKKKLQIEAEATAGGKGQPLESLHLLLDGRAHPDVKPVEVKAGGPATAAWEIDLLPGKHELKVLARCRSISGASEARPLP